jgi:hypothetical protein
MDEVQRKQFLDTLRQDAEFRADVRRELLIEELLGLPQSVALLSAAVNGLIEHQAEMQRELTALRGDMTALRSDMTETRGDVTALIATTRQLLVLTQNLATEMRQGFTSVDARFDQVGADITDIRDRLAS